MNPAEVAQQALPLASSDLSIFTLFWQAHWLVKAVMLGLFARLDLGVGDRGRQDHPLRAHPPRHGQLSRMRSGPASRWRNSTRRCRRARRTSMAALVRRRHARVEALVRKPVAFVRRPADAHRPGHECDHRARDRTAGAPPAGAGDGRLGRPVCRPVRHGLGHHDQSFQSIAASKNTSLAVVAPGIAEALFATAIGLIAAIPATIFYNKFVVRSEQAGAAARRLCRRVFRNSVAPDRRTELRR